MSEEFPLELADLCVKCGLCAPHCPTYALDRIEPESPRGRIAIMAALASAQIEPGTIATQHLDHCLGCQACEAVCPAKVPYLRLLDAHRAGPHQPRGRIDPLIQAVLAPGRLRRPLLRSMLKLLAALRPLALRLAPARLSRLASLAPPAPRLRLPRSQRDASVQILVGCLGDLANDRALGALVRLCQALGHRVELLPAGQCCGALARHRGDAGRAASQLATVAAQRRPDLPLIALDSACTAHLRSEGMTDAQEACAFLAACDWSGLTLRPLPARVAIHEPCSHRNGLRERGAAMRLLSRIPELQCESIADPFCCGAAGLHMLDEPARADSLLAPKLKACRESGASHLVTTNVGCALHLAGGLRRTHLQPDDPSPTVVHPVELIASQLHA